jgi:hypothetical protein
MAAVDPLVEPLAQLLYRTVFRDGLALPWEQVSHRTQVDYRDIATSVLAMVQNAGRLHPSDADEPVLEWATMEPFKGLMFWPTEAEAREYAGMTEHCNLYSRVRWWAHATDWELR